MELFFSTTESLRCTERFGLPKTPPFAYQFSKIYDQALKMETLGHVIVRRYHHSERW